MKFFNQCFYHFSPEFRISIFSHFILSTLTLTEVRIPECCLSELSCPLTPSSVVSLSIQRFDFDDTGLELTHHNFFVIWFPASMLPVNWFSFSLHSKVTFQVQIKRIEPVSKVIAHNCSDHT